MAENDPRLEGVDYQVVSTGRVSSLEEAARARGMVPSQIIKTMVARRGSDNYIFVLVPGDRVISWPKLRKLLGVNRIAMPDSDEARLVTGYERGTITPLGSAITWPVVADERVAGTVSIGGGAHGVSLTIEASDLLALLEADVGDVTDEDEP